MPLDYLTFPSHHFKTNKISVLSSRHILSSPNKHVLIIYYVPIFADFIQGIVLAFRTDRLHLLSSNVEMILLSFLSAHNWIYSIPLLTGKKPNRPWWPFGFCQFFLNSSLPHNLPETPASVIPLHHLTQRSARRSFYINIHWIKSWQAAAMGSNSHNGVY